MNESQRDGSGIEPYRWRLLVGSMMPLYVWIIAANTLTLVCIATNSRLQTKTYALVGSLAAVDLSVGIINIITVGVYASTLQGHTKMAYSHQQTLCAAMIGIIIAPTLNSNFHLCLVALDRYVAVIHPFRYEEVITPQRIKALIACSWLVSSGLAMSSFGWRHRVEGSCAWAFLYLPPQYLASFVGLPVCISSLTMMGLYGKVFWAARKQIQRINDENMASNVPSDMQSDKTAKSKWKLVKMLALIIGVYVLCNFPTYCFFIVGFIIGQDSMIGSTAVSIIYQIIAFLVIANSGMNFIIYVRKDKVFRQTLAKMCRSQHHSGQPNISGQTMTTGF